MATMLRRRCVRCLPRVVSLRLRLVEFVSANPTDSTPMWLELYSHETQCAIDSFRCYDLEAAVQATEGACFASQEA
jgi:hypothetical protein